MTTLTEGQHSYEFLLSEANGQLSREQIIVVANAAAMIPGTLVGKITASGKYTVYNNAASDGTQTAVGILVAATTLQAADQKAVIIARQAEVFGAQLTASDTAGQADLLLNNIIYR